MRSIIKKWINILKEAKQQIFNDIEKSLENKKREISYRKFQAEINDRIKTDLKENK